MILKEKIISLVEEKVSGTGIFIVDVSVSPSNKIIVLVDTLSGITIEECILISKFIENSFNRDVDDFELEVSSPGLSQPFKVYMQYVKNIGKNVTVLTSANQKLKGKLLAATDQGIELETLVIKKNENKKKISETEIVKLSFDQIKSTKIVISF